MPHSSTTALMFLMDSMLAVRHDAAGTRHGHAAAWTVFSSPGYILRTGTCRIVQKFCASPLWDCGQFSKGLHHPSCHPVGSDFSTLATALSSHPRVQEVTPHRGLIFTFLMESFHKLVGYWHISGNCLFRSLTYFKTGLFEASLWSSS